MKSRISFPVTVERHGLTMSAIIAPSLDAVGVSIGRRLRCHRSGIVAHR